jgi:hypothetical protein
MSKAYGIKVRWVVLEGGTRKIDLLQLANVKELEAIIADITDIKDNLAKRKNP